MILSKRGHRVQVTGSLRIPRQECAHQVFPIYYGRGSPGKCQPLFDYLRIPPPWRKRARSEGPLLRSPCDRSDCDSWSPAVTIGCLPEGSLPTQHCSATEGRPPPANRDPCPVTDEWNGVLYSSCPPWAGRLAGALGRERPTAVAHPLFFVRDDSAGVLVELGWTFHVDRTH